MVVVGVTVRCLAEHAFNLAGNPGELNSNICLFVGQEKWPTGV